MGVHGSKHEDKCLLWYYVVQSDTSGKTLLITRWKRGKCVSPILWQPYDILRNVSAQKTRILYIIQSKSLKSKIIHASTFLTTVPGLPSYGGKQREINDTHQDVLGRHWERRSLTETALHPSSNHPVSSFTFDSRGRWGIRLASGTFTICVHHWYRLIDAIPWAWRRTKPTKYHICLF
jgi:hypothetical protein